MTQLNPVVQRRILDQDYVSINDLRSLYGWSKAQATIEFKHIQHRLEEENKPIMNRGRMLMIPIDIILEKYPLSYQKIDRAAKRIVEELHKWQKEDI